jgi:sugar phosphate isomerase/epimerase
MAPRPGRRRGTFAVDTFLRPMPARTQHPVAATVAPLGDPASALAWLSASGIRGAQLSAAQPGTRPRELGESARRDLRATLVRLELVASGIDAWIPPAHFTDPANLERAIDAVAGACELAGELGRVPVCVMLPGPGDDDASSARRREAIAAIGAAADRHGVTVADAGPSTDLAFPPFGRCIDPAAVLAAGGDPAAEASRLGARLAAARIVDLTRAGMRAPIEVAGESRLDAFAYRIALEVAGFRGVPVIDARQWTEPRAGILASVRAWGGPAAA